MKLTPRTAFCNSGGMAAQTTSLSQGLIVLLSHPVSINKPSTVVSNRVYSKGHSFCCTRTDKCSKYTAKILPVLTPVRLALMQWALRVLLTPARGRNDGRVGSHYVEAAVVAPPAGRAGGRFTERNWSQGTRVGYLTLPNVTLASIIRELSLNKHPMTREHETGSSLWCYTYILFARFFSQGENMDNHDVYSPTVIWVVPAKSLISTE